MSRKARLSVAAIVVFSAAVVWHHVLRVPLAVALVLLLPGYALTAALFARRALDLPRRLVLSISLSLAIDVLLALVLNLLPYGLRTGSWTVGVTVITCVAAGVAIRRRPGRRTGPVAPGSIRFRRLDVMFLVLACLVFGAAVGLARTPLKAIRAQGYTMLWLLPTRDADDVRVGVQSGELESTRYRLVVRMGNRVTYRRAFVLQPGATLTKRIRVTPLGAKRRAPVVAELYRLDVGSTVYRLARLWPTGSRVQQ